MDTPNSFTNKTYTLSDSDHYLIRAIQLDDRERIIELFNHLSPESRYLRFAHAISKLPDDFLDDILHLDYKKEMALLAIMSNQSGAEELIGIARYVTPPNQNVCAITILEGTKPETTLKTKMILNWAGIRITLSYLYWITQSPIGC